MIGGIIFTGRSVLLRWNIACKDGRNERGNRKERSHLEGTNENGVLPLQSCWAEPNVYVISWIKGHSVPGVEVN